MKSESEKIVLKDYIMGSDIGPNYIQKPIREVV